MWFSGEMCAVYVCMYVCMYVCPSVKIALHCLILDDCSIGVLECSIRVYLL